MVPKPGSPSASIKSPFPPLTRSTTLPVHLPADVAPNRALLAPEDAIYQGSPPRKQSMGGVSIKDLRMTNGSNADVRPRRGRQGEHRSGSRRKKGAWKKLLWVKQSCESRML